MAGPLFLGGERLTCISYNNSVVTMCRVGTLQKLPHKLLILFAGILAEFRNAGPGDRGATIIHTDDFKSLAISVDFL
jgi:hypothetical protein